MELKYITVILFSFILSYSSTSGMKYNCSDTDLKLVSCGPSNSSRDQCLGLGCCWNSSLVADNATQCYGIPNNQTPSNSAHTTSVPMPTTKNSSTRETLRTTAGPKGTCQVYRDRPLCDRWLNVTMLEHRWTPRFTDNRFGVNGTESMIAAFMYVINRIDGQEKCKNILRPLVCEYFLPPCNENNEPYSYCREDCEALFDVCDLAMRELLGAAKYFHKEPGKDLAHASMPNCTKLPYYADTRLGNHTCVRFGLLNFTQKPSIQQKKESSQSSLKFNTNAIAATIAGAVTLLVVIIVTACILKRQKRKPLTSSKDLKSITFTAMTMRDRIRAESMHALDESKVLSLFNPDDMKQLPLTSIEYVRDLGSGNFGLVFLGKTYCLNEGKADSELMVAVKTLKEGSSTEIKEDFIQEVALMSVLHHKNIVELLAVSMDEEPYGMIFEFMDLGDLNQYLRKAGPFFEGDEKEKVTLTSNDLMSISLQCAAGMEHLQMLRFVHRDVATRNCLVGTGLIVKIADFGMSRDIYSSDYYKVEGKVMLPIRWMPPEALLLGKFTVESDIYSFGVLLWEIYSLALQPYYGYTNEEVMEFIKQGIVLGQPDQCPDHVYQIMKSCWHKDASQRPDFTLMIAQLKQEVTTQHESPDHPLPVHDKQSFYQNIGFSPEEFKEEIPIEKNPTKKISEQAPGTPETGYVRPSSGYVNVALSLGVV